MPRTLELSAIDAQRIAIALVTHRRELGSALSSIRVPDAESGQPVPEHMTDLLGELVDEMNAFRLLSGKVAEILSDYAADNYARRLRDVENFGGAAPCVLSKID
jgi:hypothetical protein